MNYFRTMFMVGLLVFAFHDALAQRFLRQQEVSAFLATEESTKLELEKLQKLSPSKSAALNQEALGEAKATIDALRSLQEQISETERQLAQISKQKPSIAVNDLLKSTDKCDRKAVTQVQLAVQRQLEQLRIPSFPFSNSIYTEAEEATLKEVGRFLEMSPEQVCIQFKDKQAVAGLAAQADQSLDIIKASLEKSLTTFREQAPRAKKLGDAWERYRDLLLKSIEDQSAPATKVADQLGWIIGTFCLFGILIFLSLKAFSDSVQMELVASGQVIQFATVMVLLIVVCILGMSQILKENTLGTLLGGIGGYVLAQGVGRAARDVAMKAVQDKTKSESKGSGSGGNGSGT